MQARTLRILIISLFSTALILSVVLGVHIYLVTESFEANNHAQWQLHKINFERPISRVEEKAVKTKLYEIGELKRVHFNRSNTAAVLAIEHPSKIKVGDPKLKRALPEEIQSIASLYVPTKEELSKGCPVNPNESLPKQVSGFFASVFK